MYLKTKIPPPLVALIFGFLINYTKNIFPKIEISNDIIFGSFMIIIGLIIILSAIILFKKYQTTITPLNPSNATKLITDGIYKFSRNPMYLGLLLVLIGISIILNPIGGLSLIPLFSSIWAIIFLGEAFALFHFFGITCIALGILLANYKTHL